ncbi:carboxypeptidase-like regulatory domain-containing protein [Flammeovirga yaeyamensis]|uniref:Carboxypeptidase-like regulatory domain-containing protein n=1 Tax=Flammeovirga yaeyamensis TaxID=367791 RepID=A0AAX1N6B1_9BACT|nr:carboxypeptidase-like regulatory domain-containing protein [Flammeovirga yaeyamensis]MBB3697721.1 hypothetical protein [Flammeovirga yaeyamensis]NMF35921.1 TonB-dependent receptor [Flammeovirga yaeyamensis]QWG03129.1 carboxypeptidase-like regulatory domain-containing protein [Flammeovirga yaeyamensis]
MKTKLLLLFLLLGVNFSVFSQSGESSIEGKIVDEDAQALPGALIKIKNLSTGFSTGTISSANGDFSIKSVPVGGPYEVNISFMGYAEQKVTIERVNQGDKLNLNINLKNDDTELDEVVISSNSVINQMKQFGATTAVGQMEIKNLPTEGRNFSKLAAISPLQGGGDLNLGGQRRTSTGISIDGLNARNPLGAGEVSGGPWSISQEAIGEFQVTTNDYDVVEGRAGGGSVRAITRGGTNEWEGSVFSYVRNDHLQSKYDVNGNERTSKFSTTQYGASLGGAIVKDKLHFFTVFEQELSTSPYYIADIRNEDDENRLGISRGNLNRFVQIGREQYGLSDDQQTGEFSQNRDAKTWFARMDWNINEKHRLTLSNNLVTFKRPFSVNDNSNFNMAETVGDYEDGHNTTNLVLRSKWSDKWLSSTKVQYQSQYKNFTPNSQLPDANIPRAIVYVTSELPNGSTARKSLQLGGQRYLPELNESTVVQFNNTTHYTGNKVSFTFGGDLLYTNMYTLLSNEQNGRFYFNSLEDFANMNPFRYAREVPIDGLPDVDQDIIDFAFFAQAEFKLHRDIEAVVGLRYDATTFLTQGAYNPLVHQELGIRTDNKISDYNNIQPRVQLTWDVGGNNKDIVKLGGGMFTAQPPYYAMVNNIQNSGMKLAATDVTGDLVPYPDFIRYRNDPSSAPGIIEGADLMSTINSSSPDFEMPEIWKTNLSYTHVFQNRYTLGINLLASYTRNNYVYQEVNLKDEPVFYDGATGRSVFVDPSYIDENGNVDWKGSRKSENVGRTLELNSDGIGKQFAMILSGSAQIGKDGYVSASYTYNNSHDNSSYNCCVANTSTFLPVEGDPRALNWGPSDNNFKNKVVVNGASPTFKGFSVGFTFIGIGGGNYTFLNSSNTSVNGDFTTRNDVAYIFDPNAASTPQHIKDGYDQILNDPNVSNSVKDYLRDSFGGYAKRNGGVNPMNFNLDLRLTYDLKIFQEKNKLRLTMDAFNVMNMVNKEWGITHNHGDQEIMRVTGFDHDTNSFEYEVNTNVGAIPNNGTPWRLQLGAKYMF